MTEQKKRGRPSPELDRIKRDLAPRFLCEAADHSLIWKRCLQNTVTSDPLVPSGGGDVIGCYLDFSSPENDPFRTMAHLTALTGYKAEKVRKIVAALIACGYMVRTGMEPSGAVTYRLTNPRASAVLDHVASEIVVARNDDAAKKRVKRSRVQTNVPSKNQGDKSAIVPSKTGRDVPSKSEGDVPSKLGVQYREDTLTNTGGSALQAETALTYDLFDLGLWAGPEEEPFIETRLLEERALSEFGDPPSLDPIPEEASSVPVGEDPIFDCRFLDEIPVEEFGGPPSFEAIAEDASSYAPWGASDASLDDGPFDDFDEPEQTYAAVFREDEDPEEFFFGIGLHERIEVEDETAGAALCAFLLGLCKIDDIGVFGARLTRTVRVGELTRFKFFSLINSKESRDAQI